MRSVQHCMFCPQFAGAHRRVQDRAVRAVGLPSAMASFQSVRICQERGPTDHSDRKTVQRLLRRSTFGQDEPRRVGQVVPLALLQQLARLRGRGVAQPISNQSAINLLSICYQTAINLLSICYQSAINLRSRCNQDAINMQSTCNQHAINMQQRCSETDLDGVVRGLAQQQFGDPHASLRGN